MGNGSVPSRAMWLIIWLFGSSEIGPEELGPEEFEKKTNKQTNKEKKKKKKNDEIKRERMFSNTLGPSFEST